MFKLASLIAKKTTDKRRDFLHGAIGIRRDGVLVSASNLPALTRTPAVHAEYRVVKKLDVGSVIYVIRLGRKENVLRNSKPCSACESVMKNNGVAKCYYSISNNEFGVLTFK
jgi:tRNA(Arg) A34 adenosine deaminase TadA